MSPPTKLYGAARGSTSTMNRAIKAQPIARQIHATDRQMRTTLIGVTSNENKLSRRWRERAVLTCETLSQNQSDSTQRPAVALQRRVMSAMVASSHAGEAGPI